jgi:hypothetical protein
MYLLHAVVQAEHHVLYLSELLLTVYLAVHSMFIGGKVTVLIAPVIDILLCLITLVVLELAASKVGGLFEATADMMTC